MDAVVYMKDVFKITGIGFVIVGDIKSGILKKGMKIDINGSLAQVKMIEMNRKTVDEANSGDAVGFALSNVKYESLIELKGKDLVFSEELTQPIAQNTEDVKTVTDKYENIQPKGFFDSLKDLFKKK